MYRTHSHTSDELDKYLDASKVFHLLTVQKYPHDPMVAGIPPKNKMNLELRSVDNERFRLDFSRKQVVLSYKIQCRYENMVPIIRLDVNTAPHHNPTDIVECESFDPFLDVHQSCVGRKFAKGEPHIHYYRQGFRDPWAYPVPDTFGNILDEERTIGDFMKMCNIISDGQEGTR